MGILLTSTTEVKGYLGILPSDTTLDASITLAIQQCSDIISEECDRVWGGGTFTEVYSGDNRPALVLNQRPVSLTGLVVVLDDNANAGQSPTAFTAVTPLVLGTDYYLDVDQPSGTLSRSGILYNLTNGFWPAPYAYSPGLIRPTVFTRSGNIQVTYTVPSSVPSQIALACDLLVCKTLRTVGFGETVTSEGYEEYNYAIKGAAKNGLMTPEINKILSRYRNVGVA